MWLWRGGVRGGHISRDVSRGPDHKVGERDVSRPENDEREGRVSSERKGDRKN